MIRRIHFVDHTGQLGGAELMLYDLAVNLPQESFVTLFSDGPFKRVLEIAGIDVNVIKARDSLLSVRKDGGKLPMGVVLEIVRLVHAVAKASRDSHVVYANTQKAFIIAAFAGLFARRPVVWHLHDILDRQHFSSRNIWLVVTLANLFAARVIANSKATALAFVASGGKPSKVAVVYNGIDTATFDKAGECSIGELRTSLGIHLGPLVGVFGRLSPWKGQDVVIDALSRLPGVQVVFVGDALFGESQFAERLYSQARELGVADRVHFLGFRSDIAILMRACDIIVHSSRSAEPFGRVIVKGMFAARPVIATNAGGATEIIDHERTGLLVTPNDPQQLANAIVRILSHDAESTKMAKAGNADARARFGLSKMLACVDEQLRLVVR